MPTEKPPANALNTSIVTFLIVTVLVFLMIAGGYIAYADSTNYFDREGATGMAVVFFYAPASGLIVGAISGSALFRFLKRRRHLG